MTAGELDQNTDTSIGRAKLGISIVIPALGEAKCINETIQHLRDQPGGMDCEIIVVDGDIHGETVNEIADMQVIAAISKRGRAKQMNAGAELATGQTLLFLHADTKLPNNAFEIITSFMDDEDNIAAAFSLGFDSDKRIMKIIQWCGNLRNRLARTPFGDQAIFLRRDYFNRIDGFQPIPIMEDVELMKRIKRRGDKVRILKDKVRTSARRYEKDGPIRRALKNNLLLRLYYLGVSPYRLAELYTKPKRRKHK